MPRMTQPKDPELEKALQKGMGAKRFGWFLEILTEYLAELNDAGRREDEETVAEFIRLVHGLLE